MLEVGATGNGRESFTYYYPMGARTVTFRYSERVTVPGKGGRPRKWLSDADRVRAFRARQSGVAEPLTIDIAIGGDDALAAVVERQHQLEVLLSESREEVKRLKRDLIATETSVYGLQERIDHLERERALLLGEIAELNERTQVHRPDSRVMDRSFPARNRAARRRASRQRR